MVIQIIDQLYLKLALQHIKLQMLKDSSELVSMIDKQDHNSFMCSFDLDYLFTKVPLEETIEIVIKNLFGRKRIMFQFFISVTLMTFLFY